MLSMPGEDDGTGGVVPSRSIGGVLMWSCLESVYRFLLHENLGSYGDSRIPSIGGMRLVVKRHRLGVATCGLLPW